MAIRSILRPEGGYVLTEQGKHDLLCAETCQCNPRLAGLLFECTDCGTVYGSLRDNGSVSRVTREKRRWD